MHHFLGATQVSSSWGWSAHLSSDRTSSLGIQPLWKVTTSHWKGQVQAETLLQLPAVSKSTAYLPKDACCALSMYYKLKKQGNKHVLEQQLGRRIPGIAFNRAHGEEGGCRHGDCGLQQEQGRTPQREEDTRNIKECGLAQEEGRSATKCYIFSGSHVWVRCCWVRWTAINPCRCWLHWAGEKSLTANWCWPVLFQLHLHFI